MAQQSDPQPPSIRPVLSALVAAGVFLVLLGLSLWVLQWGPSPRTIVQTVSPPAPAEPVPLAVPSVPWDEPVPALALARTPFAPASKAPQGASGGQGAFAAISGLPSDYLAGLPDADLALVQWLKDWESRSLEGQKTTPAQIEELSRLMESSALAFGPLYGLGRSLDDVEGPLVSRPLYALAVRRAEADMKQLPARGEKAMAYYWPLTNMQLPLYNASDYASCQKVWAMLTLMAEPGSQQEFVCRFMDYEMRAELGLHDEAYREYSRLAAEYDQSPHVDANLDLRAEMDYMMAVIRYEQGRYGEAALLFDNSLAYQGVHSAHAPRFLFVCLTRSGRIQDAEALYGTWRDQGTLSISDAILFSEMIEYGRLLSQQR